jgi:acetyl esterase/lipase
LILLSSWLLMACGCSADSPPETAAPNPPSAISVKSGVTVCQVQGQSLLGDLYLPATALSRQRALLFVHGGGWSAGRRSDFDALARALAQQGYTGLSVDYRLSPVVRHPQHLQDLKCALRWLRGQAAGLGVDTERIAVVGGSAGAYLAALLAYTPDDPALEGDGRPRSGGTRVAAAVLHGVPADLTVLETSAADARGAVHALLGTTTPTARQLREASPLSKLRPDSVATLILHGQNDRQVPVDQALRLDQALTRAGVAHVLHIIPHAGHADFGAEPDAVGRLLLEFLNTQLR